MRRGRYEEKPLSEMTERELRMELMHARHAEMWAASRVRQVQGEKDRREREG